MTEPVAGSFDLRWCPGCKDETQHEFDGKLWLCDTVGCDTESGGASQRLGLRALADVVPRRCAGSCRG